MTMCELSISYFLLGDLIFVATLFVIITFRHPEMNLENGWVETWWGKKSDDVSSDTVMPERIASWEFLNESDKEVAPLQASAIESLQPIEKIPVEKSTKSTESKPPIQKSEAEDEEEIISSFSTFSFIRLYAIILVSVLFGVHNGSTFARSG